MRLAGAPGGTVGRQKSTYILCTLEACEELPPRNHVGMYEYLCSTPTGRPLLMELPLAL